MQGRGIGAVAEPVDPRGMPRELVEAIAMNDQEPAAISRDMDELVSQLHVPKRMRGEWPQELVVIAGDVEHPRATFEHPQDPPHHEARGVVPVKAPFQLPAVDDVADEIEPVRFEVSEEPKQPLRLREPAAKVDV